MSTKVIVPVVVTSAILGLGFLAYRRYQAYMEEVTAAAARQILANGIPRSFPPQQKETPDVKPR